MNVEWLLAQDAWMRSLARGLLGDRGRAEDVVQDAYAVALSGGPGGDGRGARSWLAAVVGNLGRRARRREAARAAVEERGARAEAQGPADELVLRMELQRHLAEAVLALAEPYRSAVLLRHVENLGAAEIARRQGCTSEAARQRVARGLAELRRSLDGRFGRRSAWALALGPLATSTPVLPVALTVGGVVMGSKLVALGLAGASALVLAFLYAGGRGAPAGAPRASQPELASLGADPVGAPLELVALLEDSPARQPALEPARALAAGSVAPDAHVPAAPALEVVLRGPGGSVLDGPAHARLWVRRADGTEETVGVDPDADGRLIARDLPLGRLERVEARQRGAGRGERALDLALVPDGFARVELELARGATVHGVVLDARGGQPIPAAEVWAEDGFRSDHSPAPTAVADEHGRFELVGVDAQGVYGKPERVWCMVAAEADGYSAQFFETHSWPRNAEERYGVELQLAPTASRLEGRVHFPDERGAPARIWAVDGHAQFCFRTTSERFTLDALAAGRLELFLLTSEDAPAEARAALRASFELAEGETRTEEFRLERGSAVLRGRLIDARDQPVRGAEVVLHLNMYAPPIAFGTEEREATTGADGSFEFPAAFPGRYGLEIVSLPDGLCLEPFEDHLELAPGATHALEIRCAVPIELTGRVVLAGLDPARLRVLACAADDGAELAASIVAADGAFCFPRLYPTEIELRLLSDETELARTLAGPLSARDLVLVPGD